MSENLGRSMYILPKSKIYHHGHVTLMVEQSAAAHLPLPTQQQTMLPLWLLRVIFPSSSNPGLVSPTTFWLANKFGENVNTATARATTMAAIPFFNLSFFIVLFFLVSVFLFLTKATKNP